MCVCFEDYVGVVNVVLSKSQTEPASHPPPLGKLTDKEAAAAVARAKW